MRVSPTLGLLEDVLKARIIPTVGTTGVYLRGCHPWGMWLLGWLLRKHWEKLWFEYLSRYPGGIGVLQELPLNGTAKACMTRLSPPVIETDWIGPAPEKMPVQFIAITTLVCVVGAVSLLQTVFIPRVLRPLNGLGRVTMNASKPLPLRRSMQARSNLWMAAWQRCRAATRERGGFEAMVTQAQLNRP